jgi:uncharacterized protein
MRTCTGCGVTAPQRELVRLALVDARLVIDPLRRLPGRGAYVHPRSACVTPAGLSRSLRRRISATDVSRIVSEMSPTTDNLGVGSGDQPLQNASQNAPGLEGGDTVEMPPRIKAKDDRSEDARL